MKLVWYILSGNIILALKEIEFSSIYIETDIYKCTLYKLGRVTCRVEIEKDGRSVSYEDEADDEGDTVINAEDQANPVLMELGSSVFFPTFRRIEGGFSLESDSVRPNPLSIQSRLFRAKSDIESGLAELSARLTNSSHLFVSSISTVDISSILLRQYTDLSELSNRLQSETSQKIINIINDYKLDYSVPDHGSESLKSNVLDDIKAMVENMERERSNTMVPLDAIRVLVQRLFKHTGIKIDSRLSFGDAAKAVSSNALSAGEKQMLSFICYNAFYKNSVIFIDEPELSLHVDWQRQLFPILQSQETSNQFIIATHSPFIYSKYPDKEILLDESRGDEGVAN